MGAYISARASGTLGQVEGVSPTASFLGGFFLYIGARLGGGCTRYGNSIASYVKRSFKLLALHFRCCICFVCCSMSKIDSLLFMIAVVMDYLEWVYCPFCHSFLLHRHLQVE